METHLCNDKEGAVLDTGQSAAPASEADGLTGGAGCNQDGQKNTLESTDKTLEGAPEQASETTPTDASNSRTVAPPEETGADRAGSEGAVNEKCDSVECSGENGQLKDQFGNVSVTPKIIIEEESAECREAETSNDDDMDPLITIDDTESQSSDLINFDTVSYDVMRQHGEEEDDDEKSITTLSSLSCDIKFDSPSKHYQGSNSSSLSNLFDSSIKESLGLVVNPSAYLADCTGSAPSSCPSSPSLRSSKTMSSAVDESISEAFMNVLQISEDEEKIVNCDNKVLSQEELHSGDIYKMEIEESAIVHRSDCAESVDASKDPSPVEEIFNFHQEDLVTDSNGAQEVSSPDVENLSLVKSSVSNVPSSASCSPDESNILCDAGRNISESLIVPDNSSKDVQELHEECLVNSSSEFKKPPKPSAGICIEEDPVLSCPNISPKDMEITQNILSTANEEITPSVLENVDTVSSTTEGEVHVSTSSHDDAHNLLTVLSTSNENPSCSASVVTSTLGSVPNDSEDHVSSHSSDINENISLKENISSLSALLVSGEDIEKNSFDKINSSMVSQSMEEISESQEVLRSPSPTDSALSVSNCITSEESIQRMSCDSSNETMELISSEAISGDISPPERLCVSNVPSGFEINGGVLQSLPDCYSKNAEPVEIPNSEKLCKRELSPFEGSLEGELINHEQQKSEGENSCVSTSFEKDVPVITDSCDILIKGDLANKSSTIAGLVDTKTKRPMTLLEINSNKLSSEKSSGMNFTEFLGLFSASNVEGVSKPKQYDVAALDEAQQMASFLVDDILQKAMIKAEEKLNSSESLIGDRVETVQVAQTLVDGVLTEASAHVSLVDVKKAESKTCDLKDSGGDYSINNSATEDLYSQVTDIILSTEPSLVVNPESIVNFTDNLSDSQKNVLNISENVSKLSHRNSEGFCEENLLPFITTNSEIVPNIISDAIPDIVNVSEDRSLSDNLIDVQSKESARTSSTETAAADSSRSSLHTTSDLELRSEASLFVDGVLEEAAKKYEESLSSDSSPVKIRSREENLLPCITTNAEMVPTIITGASPDIVNVSEDSSLSDSLIDVQSKESAKTSSTETAAADSSRSSLRTTSDLGLRSEASLFVDGVLEEAVKKYEESSSSDSSPVKIRSLALDSEFLQEEEELATPCGEMLTEHFMDFESGRNVSVFCSIPENRNEDHLLAYDRVAHTIGNREVDSDTGKSVSVFRIEEEVFYEIQRASTCTSVFESVEEEDEDMIDTTIPVEERPEKTMSTSASFPSYDKDKFGATDDPFSADCDAFEDAVGAFLTKERLAHNELRNRDSKAKSDCHGETEQQSEVTCRALVLRHPEIGISNSDEKKRMAEKWANGGESEVPDTPEMREKQRAIRETLDSDDDVAVKLCRLALTEGGLINDTLRREAWPRMLGLDPTLEVNAPSLEDLKSHPEYEQVVLDVNRSLKRFPPDIPKDQRETLQDKLTRLIMYVISKHPHLRYYQGYHDVAVTFLLVVGESIAFQIMERLSTEHLSDCMQPTMERTSYLLHFIYPLLHRLHPTLADYLERSEVGTMFCLPWFLTWFGHSLDHYKDVVRLYDHFLASPPLAPLYVAAVLVAHRADEVLAVDCDMAAIHALLSHIPDSLPLEILLRDATELYMKFPPESIEREVEERFRNEQDMRVQEMEARDRVRRQRIVRRHRGHDHGSGSWQLAEIQDRIGGSMMTLNRWMPPWVVQQQRLSMRLLFASATFFVGFYVYSRGGDMLPYP